MIPRDPVLRSHPQIPSPKDPISRPHPQTPSGNPILRPHPSKIPSSDPAPRSHPLHAQRPMYAGAEDIGSWMSVLRTLAVIGVFTNMGLVGYTSVQFQQLLPFTVLGLEVTHESRRPPDPCGAFGSSHRIPVEPIRSHQISSDPIHSPPAHRCTEPPSSSSAPHLPACSCLRTPHPLPTAAQSHFPLPGGARGVGLAADHALLSSRLPTGHGHRPRSPRVSTAGSEAVGSGLMGSVFVGSGFVGSGFVGSTCWDPK